MSKHVAVLPAKIRARWDRIALEQLAQCASQQADEIDSLVKLLHQAEDAAEYWQQQVDRFKDEGGRFAMTRDGQLYPLAQHS